MQDRRKEDRNGGGDEKKRTFWKERGYGEERTEGEEVGTGAGLGGEFMETKKELRIVFLVMKPAKSTTCLLVNASAWSMEKKYMARTKFSSGSSTGCGKRR